jgi:toluene monooxygenase system ferredoxin subunit
MADTPALADQARWTRAVALDELWEGEMIGVRLGETDVLLVNLGGDGIHAYDNRCPHARSRLSEGHLRTTTLQCASHLWEFDARSGCSINPKNVALRRYPVKVVDDYVMVCVPVP